LNQACPRLHAALVSTIFSPSACSSISSHTHPQKVQVAFLTIVRPALALGIAFAFVLLVARTGRDGKRSPQLAADATATDALWLKAARLDFLPGGNVGRIRLGFSHVPFSI